MKKQPLRKGTTKVGEINNLCRHEADTSETIHSLIAKFDLNSKLKPFEDIKKKGFKVSELIIILLVMPFLRLRIDTMSQKGRGRGLSQAKKDAYYDLKNNEQINWRGVLSVLVKQFVKLRDAECHQGQTGTSALIGDDTTVCKSGLKIEKTSRVHDHTTGSFLFGFKVLVLGWYDGKSFVPIDFSIHREKGTGSRKAQKRCEKAEARLKANRLICKGKESKLKGAKEAGKQLATRYKPEGKQHGKALESNRKKLAKLRLELKKMKEAIENQEQAYKCLVQAYKESKKKHQLCGLSESQRRGQFKKDRAKNSFGYKREKEVDCKKTDNLLKMIQRSSRLNIKADYFIADSWFFCTKLITGVLQSKMGMHYLGMVPQRETIHYAYGGKMVDSAYLLKDAKVKTHRCRRFRSSYRSVQVEYAGTQMRLYFIKMGSCKTWKLLATTDLSLSFTKLFELYQIRWSIEVFFKECKQYLGFGKCQSRDFDAQICSITLSMMQHIILCYHKRIHSQQKMDGIFEDIGYQTMEATIVERMIAQFIELLDIVAQTVGVEPIELYLKLIQNPKAVKILRELRLEAFMEGKKAA